MTGSTHKLIHKINPPKLKTTNSTGFTIVELLIVIVVIGILASISLIAFSGVQGRARDAQRKQDVRVIAQALEMYYSDNGTYPRGRCTANCSINSGWSSTNDNSWVNLESALVPEYLSNLPADPKPTTGGTPQDRNPQRAGVYGYGYFSSQGSYCGSGTQTYILIYTLESGDQQNTYSGECTAPRLGPYLNASNYRVVSGG